MANTGKVGYDELSKAMRLSVDLGAPQEAIDGFNGLVMESRFNSFSDYSYEATLILACHSKVTCDGYKEDWAKAVHEALFGPIPTYDVRRE